MQVTCKVEKWEENCEELHQLIVIYEYLKYLPLLEVQRMEGKMKGADRWMEWVGWI